MDIKAEIARLFHIDIAQEEKNWSIYQAYHKAENERREYFHTEIRPKVEILKKLDPDLKGLTMWELYNRTKESFSESGTEGRTLDRTEKSAESSSISTEDWPEIPV